MPERDANQLAADARKAFDDLDSGELETTVLATLDGLVARIADLEAQVAALTQEPHPAWVKAREREKAALLREKAEHARAEAAEAALADTRQALAEIEALALRDGSGVISIARRALAAADGNTP